MTTDKQAVKAIADAIIKATRAVTQDNNKNYVNNQIKNFGGGGGSGGSGSGGGSISGTISASQVTDLYTTVAGYIINAQGNADGGDVVAGRIIQTLNGIASLEVSRARIGYAQIDNLDAGVANIIHLTAQQAEIEDATIRQLKADIAQVGLTNIGTANIDYAQIKDIVAGTAIFREGLGNKLFIDRLSVTDANMTSLTAGEIMLKDSSGNLVRLVVDSETGNVGSEAVSFSGNRIIDNNSLNATKIVENSITARELNVSSIFADNALIGAIKANNIDVNDLFANTTFTNQLYTYSIKAPNAGTDIDISNNSEITLLKNRIALVVQDGSTSSSIVLTPGMISAISDQIDLKADTIDLSANQSVALKVSTEIQNTLPGEVNTAVNNAVSPINTRVTTLESTVESQAGQISLLATKEEVGQVDDKVESNITEIAELNTKYDSITLTVAKKSTNFRQETQPTSAEAGDIWVIPSTGKQYQAVDNEGTISWVEVVSSEFSQLVVKVNGIESAVSDLDGDISLVSQKADKIDWIVASGTSSGTMQLTSDMAQLIVDTVDLHADEIDLSANTTVRITSANQITAAALNAIDLSANNSVLVTIGNNVERAIDDIEIGGRNIIRNGRFDLGSKYWTEWTNNGGPTTCEIVELDNKKWMHIVSTDEDQGFKQNEGMRIYPDNVYTLSMRTRGTHVACGFYFKDSNNNTITQVWESYDDGSASSDSLRSFSFRVNGQYTTVDRFEVMLGSTFDTAHEMWITDIKLERGTKATDWTAAPEDVEELTVEAAVQSAAEINTLTGEASGSFIVVEDGVLAPLGGFVIYGKCIQNGTPTPTNPSEIKYIGENGFIELVNSGKNLVNYEIWSEVETVNGVSVFENNGITITAEDNNCYTAYNGNGYPVDAHIPVIVGETIILSWEEEEDISGMVCIYPNGDATNAVSVDNSTAKILQYTPTSGVNFITFGFGVQNAGSTISYKNIMVRFASVSDSTYEINNRLVDNMLPVSDGLLGVVTNGDGNYTDSNGQTWICDTIDKINSQYIQRVELVSINDPDLVIMNSATSWTYNGPVYKNDDESAIMSNKFSYGSSTDSCSIDQNGYITWTTSTSYGSASDMLDAVGEIVFVVPIVYPEISSLGSGQIDVLDGLQTYYGTTIIYNVVNADMVLTYIKQSNDGNYFGAMSAQKDRSISDVEEATDNAQTLAESAKESADLANGAANAAQSTASNAKAVTDNIKKWFTFSDDGLVIKEKNSKWSTAVTNDGFYIFNSDAVDYKNNPVGRFYSDRLEVKNLIFTYHDANHVNTGSILMKASASGGIMWI